ncbi:MAG TPA: hypothetical protein VH062_17295 [Polyangiaceae bacterium]|jgi:predicted metal-dependent HD superfamily phosphohydrolase|nr:hypothetical protein [Polyangiaceae bacterium]
MSKRFDGNSAKRTIPAEPGPTEGDIRTPDLHELQSRFERAARAAGATGPGEDLFRELVARYHEPHRHYHTLAHIDACLVWLDWFSGSAEHAEEVELALWFHDAVYALGGEDNELRSAELVRARLGALGVSTAVLERIAACVESTARHIASGPDAALVVDLDLSILGAGPRDFERFEAQIRREYAHVPEPVFRAARCGVLEQFLRRPVLYTTPAIRAELETRARDSLTRRIAELSGGHTAARTSSELPLRVEQPRPSGTMRGTW